MSVRFVVATLIPAGLVGSSGRAGTRYFCVEIICVVLVVTSCARDVCPAARTPSRAGHSLDSRATPSLSATDTVVDFHLDPGFGGESYDKGDLKTYGLHLRVQRIGTAASLRAWQGVACEAHTELSWQYPLTSDEFDEIVRCLAPPSLWSSREAQLHHAPGGSVIPCGVCWGCWGSS